MRNLFVHFSSVFSVFYFHFFLFYFHSLFFLSFPFLLCFPLRSFPLLSFPFLDFGWSSRQYYYYYFLSYHFIFLFLMLLFRSQMIVSIHLIFRHSLKAKVLTHSLLYVQPIKSTAHPSLSLTPHSFPLLSPSSTRSLAILSLFHNPF